MHWVVYLIIAVCVALSVFFAVKLLHSKPKDKNAVKKTNDEKSTKLAEKTQVEFCDEVEKKVSPAVFNKEEIIKEFNKKNKQTEKNENYIEFEKVVEIKTADKTESAVKQKEQQVADEVSSLSETLKAILFTDIIKPKS